MADGTSIAEIIGRMLPEKQIPDGGVSTGGINVMQQNDPRIGDLVNSDRQIIDVLQSIYRVLVEQLQFDKISEETKELQQITQPKDYERLKDEYENDSEIIKDQRREVADSFIALIPGLSTLKAILEKIGLFITKIGAWFAILESFEMIGDSLREKLSWLLPSKLDDPFNMDRDLGNLKYNGPMSNEVFESTRIPKTEGGEAARFERGMSPERFESQRSPKNITTSDMGSKDTLIAQTYNAFRNAGFSGEQAKALVAEVGRENSFRPDIIFGRHIDPKNKAVNLGMFSWQKERGQELEKDLRERNLIDENGQLVRSQETLNVMAEFAKKEMETKREYSRTKREFLENPDISKDKAAEVLGKNYIKWRYDDPRYATGHKNREEHYKRISNILDKNKELEPVEETQPDNDSNIVAKNDVKDKNASIKKIYPEDSIEEDEEEEVSEEILSDNKSSYDTKKISKESKSPEEIQAKINEYYDKGELVKDKNIKTTSVEPVKSDKTFNQKSIFSQNENPFYDMQNVVNKVGSTVYSAQGIKQSMGQGGLYGIQGAIGGVQSVLGMGGINSPEIRGVQSVLGDVGNVMSSVEGVRNIGRGFGQGAGIFGAINTASNVLGSFGNILGAGNRIGGTIENMPKASIESQNMYSETNKTGENLVGLQNENIDKKLSDVGVSGIGDSIDNVSAAGQSASGTIGRNAGIGAASSGSGFKSGDARAGTSSGAMGIQLGVRNEESVLQKAQYAAVRVV